MWTGWRNISEIALFSSNQQNKYFANLEKGLISVEVFATFSNTFLQVYVVQTQGIGLWTSSIASFPLIPELEVDSCVVDTVLRIKTKEQVYHNHTLGTWRKNVLFISISCGVAVIKFFYILFSLLGTLKTNVNPV